jgi:hypothetical protein
MGAEQLTGTGNFRACRVGWSNVRFGEDGAHLKIYAARLTGSRGKVVVVDDPVAKRLVLSSTRRAAR